MKEWRESCHHTTKIVAEYSFRAIHYTSPKAVERRDYGQFERERKRRRLYFLCFEGEDDL